MACSICGEKGHNCRTCSQARTKKGKPTKTKAKRGGQPGNTNAVKHGLYSKRFLPGEIEMLELVEDNRLNVEHEIDMLRVVVGRVLGLIGSVGAEDGYMNMMPEDIPPLVNALTSGAQRIGHLVRIQYTVFGKKKDLDEVLKDALRDAAEELGLV